MFSSKEVKTEHEEAEICLPVDHHLHSSCSDPYSTLGGALESTEPIVPDCVKTECDLSPGRPSDQTSHLRRTEKGGHPAHVTLRSQQSKNEEGNITEFKNEPPDCFDDFLEEFMKQKTNEEAVNLNKTEDEVLRLSECEVSRSRVCHTLMYKRIKISNRDIKCPNTTFSKPNTIHEADEDQSYTDSESRQSVDKKVEGHRKKNHFCQLCGRGYVHKFHLGQHMKTHTGEKGYRCQECGAAFYRNDGLQAHMRVHSGTRPFTCDECGQSFRRRGNMTEHKRYCHAEPVYRGEYGRQFADVCDLKKRQMTHKGKRQRPFTCTKCGKGFIRAGDLKMHQMTHSGERPFTCTECGHRFQRSCTLKKHMRIHTGERPYLCSECGKTFRQAFSYSCHMKIHRRRTTSAGENALERDCSLLLP